MDLGATYDGQDKINWWGNPRLDSSTGWHGSTKGNGWWSITLAGEQQYTASSISVKKRGDNTWTV